MSTVNNTQIPVAEGPDYSDGCSKDGFVGGCERIGCCEEQDDQEQPKMTKTVSVPVELLERVLYIFDNYVTFVNAAEDELRALLAQPDAQVTEDVLRDAERYRWLRHDNNDEDLLHFTTATNAGPDDVWLLRERKLDAAIDAATQEQE